MKKVLLPSLLLLVVLYSCRNEKPVISDPDNYYRELEEWRSLRLERLKGRNGWLNLAGLYWLDEGANTFGSDSSNHIIFPEKAAPFCGTITLQNGTCTLHALPASGATADSITVSELILKDDQSGRPTKIEMGSLGWYIIKRDSLYGIRLRDYESPAIAALHEIPSYPPDINWVVRAEYVPYDSAVVFSVPTAIGTLEEYKCQGELRFRINGTKQRLVASTEGNGLFIIMADATSGRETYGAGRYLSAPLPDSSNQVILDFNRATNPPCAFTPYATCPMPPRENLMDVAIEAGEKSVGH